MILQSTMINLPVTFFDIPKELKNKIIFEFWINRYEDIKKNICEKENEHESLCAESSAIYHKQNRLMRKRDELQNITLHDHANLYQLNNAINSKINDLQTKSIEIRNLMRDTIVEIANLHQHEIQIRIRIELLGISGGNLFDWQKRLEKIDICHFRDCM